MPAEACSIRARIAGVLAAAPAKARIGLEIWADRESILRRGLFLLVAVYAILGSPLAAAMDAKPLPAGPAAALDADITTTYSYYGGPSISFLTCGSLPESDGCYGSGSLSGMVRPCAILEGPSVTDGDTITRNIFVLDSGDGSSAGVTLDVFQRTYAFSGNEYMTVTSKLLDAIPLPLVSGADLSCSMAANSGFVYAGTSASKQVAQISLTTYVVLNVGGTSPPLPVTQITGNSAGYVVVTFGEGTGFGQSGFDIFGPDGSVLQHGSGEVFTGNPLNGITLR